MKTQYQDLNNKISILNFSINKGEEDCKKSSDLIGQVFGNLRLRAIELNTELSKHLEISPEVEIEHE